MMGGLGVIHIGGRDSPCGFRPEIILGKYRQQGSHHSGAARQPFGRRRSRFDRLRTAPSPTRRQRPPRQARRRLRLAQSGDVEIYIDEYGRRVIVDSFTGEVLGIQRPRQNRDYRRQRRLRELNRDQGGFLLDDPDADIPYRPRPYYQGRPVEEYPEHSDEPYPETPE